MPYLPQSLTEGLNPTVPPLYRYVCDICQDYFIVRGKYLKHVALHKNDCTEQLQTENAYECAVCKERKCLASDFVDHVLSHQYVDPAYIDERTYQMKREILSRLLKEHRDKCFSAESDKEDYCSVEHEFKNSKGASTSINENKDTLDDNVLSSHKSDFEESSESLFQEPHANDNESATNKPNVIMEMLQEIRHALTSEETVRQSLKRTRSGRVVKPRKLFEDEIEIKYRRTDSKKMHIATEENTYTALHKYESIFTEGWSEEVTLKIPNLICDNVFQGNVCGPSTAGPRKKGPQSSGNEGYIKSLGRNNPNLSEKSKNDKNCDGNIDVIKSVASENHELCNASNLPIPKRSRLSKKENETKKAKEKHCDGNDITNSMASEDLVVPRTFQKLVLSKKNGQSSNGVDDINEEPKHGLLAVNRSTLASISTDIPQLGSEFVYVGPKTDINKIKEAIKVIKAMSKENDCGINSNHSSEIVSNDILDVEVPNLTVKASATFPVSVTALSSVSQPDNVNEKSCHNNNKSVNDKSIKRSIGTRNVLVESKSDILDKNIIDDFVFIKVSPEYMKKIQEQTLELSFIQEMRSKREKDLIATLMAEVPSIWNSSISGVEPKAVDSTHPELNNVSLVSGSEIPVEESVTENHSSDFQTETFSLPKCEKMFQRYTTKMEEKKKRKFDLRKKEEKLNIEVNNEICQIKNVKRTYSRKKSAYSKDSLNKCTPQTNTSKESDEIIRGIVSDKYSDISATISDTTILCPCNSEDCDSSYKSK